MKGNFNMIGRCPWVGDCSHFSDFGFQSKYCNDSVKAQKCPYRPQNLHNKQIQDSYNYAKGNQSSVNWGIALLAVTFGGPVIYYLLKFLGVVD
jgi:hypothetical protein